MQNYFRFIVDIYQYGYDLSLAIFPYQHQLLELLLTYTGKYVVDN